MVSLLKDAGARRDARSPPWRTESEPHESSGRTPLAEIPCPGRSQSCKRRGDNAGETSNQGGAAGPRRTEGEDGGIGGAAGV